MADPIYLVQGDTGPDIKVTLTRQDTGLVESLVGATVKLHFRKKASDSVLFSLDGEGTQIDRENGIVVFSFSSGQLDISPGDYEGEVEAVFDSGARETVYQKLQFSLRKDFA